MHELVYGAVEPHLWATLLRRIFDVDILRCAHCAGRLRLFGEVVDSLQITLMLESLGIAVDAPHVARAPTELLGEVAIE